MLIPMIGQTYLHKSKTIAKLLLLFFLTVKASYALDKKAIKNQQSGQLREFMGLLFKLEQELGQAYTTQNLNPHLSAINKSFGQIAQTLPANTQAKLKGMISRLSTNNDADKNSYLTISKLKHATIEAFKIDTAPSLSPNLKLANVQYQEFCSSCHGSNGKGQGVLTERLPRRPRDFTSEQFSLNSSPLRILNTLLVGNKKGGMPAYENQLSNLELWSLSYYVQSLAHEPWAPNFDFESQLIEKGLSYSLLARLNDDELWTWINENFRHNSSLLQDRKKIIAFVRGTYSFSKKVPRR